MIDAHVHFWEPERGDYGWLTPDLAPLCRRFLPTDLAPLAEACGVDGVVAVQTAPSEAETRACYADLQRIGVAFTPLPDRDRGHSCSTIGTVRLDDVGVPTTNLGAMRCGLARAYAGWVRNAVRSSASTRPSASLSGTMVAGNGWAAASTRRNASATDIKGKAYAPLRMI